MIMHSRTSPNLMLALQTRINRRTVLKTTAALAGAVTTGMFHTQKLSAAPVPTLDLRNVGGVNYISAVKNQRRRFL
jgi:hypothetical protein